MQQVALDTDEERLQAPWLGKTSDGNRKQKKWEDTELDSRLAGILFQAGKPVSGRWLCQALDASIREVWGLLFVQPVTQATADQVRGVDSACGLGVLLK